MWYVYFYINPVDNQIFYIGKGNGNRCKSHLYRTSTWIKQGKPTNVRSLNLHLLRKISLIRDLGFEPIIEIIDYFENEKDALDREIYEISLRKESLCNITSGGEGATLPLESIEKIKLKRQEWLQSDAGLAWRKKISESRKGSGNPSFGKKEDEEHKKARMKNMLAKDRWNKGLKKDPRAKGHLKGALTHNAKKCRISNLKTNFILEEDSKSRLVKKLKELGIEISSSSIDRILALKKPIKDWWVEYVTD